MTNHWVKMRWGRFDQRRQSLLDARQKVEASEDEPGAHLHLAWHLARNNRIAEALDEWHKAVVLLPPDREFGSDHSAAQGNADLQDALGNILFVSGQREKARAEWEAASELDRFGVGDEARRKLRGRHPFGWLDII